MHGIRDQCPAYVFPGADRVEAIYLIFIAASAIEVGYEIYLVACRLDEHNTVLTDLVKMRNESARVSIGSQCYAVVWRLDSASR